MGQLVPLRQGGIVNFSKIDKEEAGGAPEVGLCKLIQLTHSLKGATLAGFNP
jgi:hypothetical protein